MPAPRLALGLIVLIMATPLRADRCRSSNGPLLPPKALHELAQLHAPILRFAAGEQYFPTVPFVTAFDGVDNDGNGLTDLADSFEVSLGAGEGRGPLWNALRDAYTKLKGKKETRRHAVFYRVCELQRSDVRELVRYLKNDLQAWNRIQADAPFGDLMDPDSTDYLVIEYYFYYVIDRGLMGHPQDRERVFVFIPQDGAAAKQLTITVGAGHSPRTPNNVLVRWAPYLGLPDLTGDTLNILVELGGHSSAPDLPPLGAFTPGVDANWQIDDLWGTRDVQAVGGLGFLGRYRPEMTFTRDVGATVLFPPSFDTPRMEQYQLKVYRQQAQVAVPDSAGGAALELPRPMEDSLAVERYLLLPVEPFKALAEAVDATPADDSRVSAAIDSIVSLLEDEWGFTGLANGRIRTAADSQAVIRWMKRWSQDMILCEDPACGARRRTVRAGGSRSLTTIPADQNRIWELDIYQREPTRIFKAHLFRPTAAATRNVDDVLDLLTYGATGYPGDAWEVHGGFIVPAFQPPVANLHLPGFLEVQVGYLRSFQHRKGTVVSSIVWEQHYNRLFSWYRKLSWTPTRGETIGDRDASTWTGGVGVSLLPYISRKGKRWDLVNVLRLRVGLTLDLFQSANVFERVGWEIQLALRQ